MCVKERMAELDLRRATAEPAGRRMSVCVPGQRLTLQINTTASSWNDKHTYPTFSHFSFSASLKGKLTCTMCKHDQFRKIPHKRLLLFILLVQLALDFWVTWMSVQEVLFSCQECFFFFLEKGSCFSAAMHMALLVFSDFHGEEARRSPGRRSESNLPDRGMHCRQEG